MDKPNPIITPKAITQKHLIKPVKLALSAMTQLLILQNEGYALLP